MKKFDFKLQKLLDIRANLEEESKVKFSNAQDEKLRAEENLKSLNANYARYSEKRKFGSVIEQKITQAYLNSLATCIKDASIEVEKKAMVLEEKRKVLTEKRIDRKTVEILKSKQEEKFRKEQEAIEQKANDEFAIYGYIRNKVERG